MSVANRPVHRPLSPHLQVYKWQLTSVMSILHRITGMAAALVVCGGAEPAGQVPAPQQVPEFRSGVELVTVDVGVVDRQGQPVRGLSPGDFTVTVAGGARRVVSAEFADGVPVRSNSICSMVSRLFAARASVTRTRPTSLRSILLRSGVTS